MSAIGEMRERVTIEEESRADDTGGGSELSWVEVATVWAAVEPLSGKESMQSGAVTCVNRYRMHMRIQDELNAAMRLVWKDRIFNIRSVRSLNARERLIEIFAEESVAV